MTGYEWLLILGMMVVTFGIRYFLLAFAGRIKMPPLLEASLNYIPPAVLTAMTVPAVLFPKGELHLSYTNPYLVAAVVATAAGIVTKSLLATIGIGLLAFFALQFLL
jgi:branched-subunit amino acid transport protein